MAPGFIFMALGEFLQGAEKIQVVNQGFYDPLRCGENRSAMIVITLCNNKSQFQEIIKPRFSINFYLFHREIYRNTFKSEIRVKLIFRVSVTICKHWQVV